MIFRMFVVGPFPENTYVVGSEDTRECAIIDPGAQAETILKDLEEQGLRVKYILNTHGHADHTAAIASLKEATGAAFGIHQEDQWLLKDPDSMGRTLIPDFREPPEPDFLIEEDDVIEFGEVKLRVIETPGHTPGGVCFYTQGILFSGDTLFQRSIGRFDLPRSDGKLLLEGIRTKLLVLPDDTQVFPGHGSQTTIGDEKRWNPFLSEPGGLAG